MIRPELRAHLWHHRESYTAAAFLAAAVWLGTRGGWLLAAIGVVAGAVGALWLMLSLRRARFARPVTDPGLVDLDEGRIGYFGAGGAVLGGYIALDDLVEIRLLQLQGTQVWRLKAQDGQALLVPVAAAGADKLYDAFAALPGIDMGALTGALTSRIPAQSLWRRRG